MNEITHFIQDNIINSDSSGYISYEQLDKLKTYFQTGHLRVHAARVISANPTLIIKEAVAKSLLYPGDTQFDGNNYTTRRYAACLRDMNYFLRYCTYAMLAGDISILDERVLNGLVETYYALDVSIEDTVKAIQAMKEAVTQFIGEDAGKEMAEYFDYICNEITTNSLVSSRQKIQRQENIPLKTRESWEPKNYQEWLKVDKLAQQLQKNGVDDQDAFTSSAIGFFEAWSRMPSELKRKVWREREVMAELCEKMNFWKKIPGFLSVGVAQRRVDGKEQLAGILNFETSNLPRKQYYKKFNIPTFLKVESSINLTEGEQQELIPILIESMEPLVKYNSSNIKPAVAISKKAPSSVLNLQSGDVVVGRNRKGRFNKSQSVTLTTFVSYQDQDLTEFKDKYVLSVNHGFKGGYNEIYTYEIEPDSRIGPIHHRNLRRKELAKKLDVAIFKIENQSLKINSHLKWIDETPELPIPVYAHMPVQMYGGVSQHQIGYIDQCMTMSPGPTSSVVPVFTANIPSQPGDSGTLLVSGHHSQNQMPYMNKKYSSITNAMLGMLVEGSTENNRLNTVFRPIIDILQQLKIKPCK